MKLTIESTTEIARFKTLEGTGEFDARLWRGLLDAPGHGEPCNCHRDLTAAVAPLVDVAKMAFDHLESTGGGLNTENLEAILERVAMTMHRARLCELRPKIPVFVFVANLAVANAEDNEPFQAELREVTRPDLVGTTGGAENMSVKVFRG